MCLLFKFPLCISCSSLHLHDDGADQSRASPDSGKEGEGEGEGVLVNVDSAVPPLAK